MNNQNKKVSCFSFTRRDFFILMFLYNLTFFSCCTLISHEPATCLRSAVLVTFLTLLILTLVDIFQKENLEEFRLQEEEKEIRNKIREEYYIAYKMRRKKELLSNIESKEDYGKNLTLDMDNPHMHTKNSFDPIKKIHFNYLEKYRNITSPEENI